MVITVAMQTKMFVTALLMGCVAGVIYDVFRITRVAFRLSWVAVMLEDMLFFLFCAFMLFRYFLYTSGGEVRLFVVGGMLLGWLIYFFTIGSIVMKIADEVISFTVQIATAVSVPVMKMLCWMVKCINNAVKPLVKQKNCLKSQASLLYNKRIHAARRRSVTECDTQKRKKSKKIPPSTP